MKKDIYEKFAFDYDEFGPIESYLGDEKNFFHKLFKMCIRDRYYISEKALVNR